MESVEKIRRFLSIDSGSGYGCGAGSGYGCGYGDGSGKGSGYGSGYGDGSGKGSGYGDGDGDGSDHGCVRKDVAAFCGETVYQIDGIATVLRKLHGNVASGFIVRGDLTTEKCFIAKSGDLFAHGRTLREAMNDLREKQFEGMPEEDRISEFIKVHKWGEQYSAVDFYEWHHRLTGSCDMGRREFANSHGFKITQDELLTVEEFIRLTENSYGSDVIKKLKREYEDQSGVNGGL